MDGMTKEMSGMMDDMTKKKMHGMGMCEMKSVLIQRQADGGGSIHPSFLTSPSGMPHDNPMTAKGEKIMSSMTKEYGVKKGKKVFYASASKGRIKGVHK